MRFCANDIIEMTHTTFLRYLNVTAKCDELHFSGLPRIYNILNAQICILILYIMTCNIILFLYLRIMTSSRLQYQIYETETSLHNKKQQLQIYNWLIKQYVSSLFGHHQTYKKMVLIKVHSFAIPMGSLGLHWSLCLFKII